MSFGNADERCAPEKCSVVWIRITFIKKKKKGEYS
jgi:hypothetical protein